MQWRYVDPTTQDSDAMSAEISVVNAFDQPVDVERCHFDGSASTCASISTIAPGHEIQTVQALTPFSTTESDELRVHPSGTVGMFAGWRLTLYDNLPIQCPIAVVVATGETPTFDPQTGAPAGTIPFATSSCLRGP